MVVDLAVAAKSYTADYIQSLCIKSPMFTARRTCCGMGRGSCRRHESRIPRPPRRRGKLRNAGSRWSLWERGHDDLVLEQLRARRIREELHDPVSYTVGKHDQIL